MQYLHAYLKWATMGIAGIPAIRMIITCLLQGTLCDTGIPRTFYGGKICSVVFFIEKKIRKIQMIFDTENWLWKSDLGTFWRSMWTSVKVKSKNYFYFTDFFAKIKPLLTHVCKIPPLRSHYRSSIFEIKFVN